jgi:flagellar assembly factor FliW
MKVETLRFGVLDVDPETLFCLPEGLVGMSEEMQFCLIEDSPDKPLKWLQIIGEPGLAFVVADPYDFYPDYECEICDQDAAFLGLQDAEDAAALALLTIAPGGVSITANLVAPLVVCTKTRRAKQVILQSEKYTTKHPLGAGVTPAVCTPAR